LLKKDPAARIRPLINILKVRAPANVVLGRNVAVDETSIACRSKFGRHLIVYNATKPTGKYHFKIYMCCCSTSWFAVSFKLHCTSGIGERLSGVIDENAVKAHEAATAKSLEVRKHVLEVTMPIHFSKRIVNTDNYYTSCQLLESLKVVGLYARGTIRENSKFGPKCFMLNKADKLQRGTIRQGVEANHKIVGASWADGAMVNILSNADDSSITKVTRLVGRTNLTHPLVFANTIKQCKVSIALTSCDPGSQSQMGIRSRSGTTSLGWHLLILPGAMRIYAGRCQVQFLTLGTRTVNLWWS